MRFLFGGRCVGAFDPPPVPDDPDERERRIASYARRAAENRPLFDEAAHRIAGEKPILRRWAAEEQAIAEPLWRVHTPDDRVAAALGRSVQCVTRHRLASGYRYGSGRRTHGRQT